jgi:multidrug resistance efflux pump
MPGSADVVTDDAESKRKLDAAEKRLAELEKARDSQTAEIASLRDLFTKAKAEPVPEKKKGFLDELFSGLFD